MSKHCNRHIWLVLGMTVLTHSDRALQRVCRRSVCAHQWPRRLRGDGCDLHIDSGVTDVACHGLHCPQWCCCRAYLSSNDVSEILSGQRQALAGIDVLRKICNHPDLLQRTQAQGSVTYGEPSRCVRAADCCWIIGDVINWYACGCSLQTCRVNAGVGAHACI